MTAEDIVSEILSKCPDVSRDQILERLEREKRRTGGFISDRALLRLIAAEFGCQTPIDKTVAPLLAITDLVPGLNDVTIIGRVVAVFSSKSFDGNRKGKLASLLVADKSGVLRVVLWNDKASMVESRKVKVGQIIRLSHGYTREDYRGTVEMHVGEKCEVEIDPKDVKVHDFPTARKLSVKIGSLKGMGRNKKVSVVGSVKKLFPVTTFERQDSTCGKVMRFVLSDDTGEVPVVVWNEKVDELDDVLKVGLQLQIVNAKIKKALGEGSELQVDSLTYVGVPSPDEEVSKLAELSEGMSRVNVEGEVASKPLIREVKTSKQGLLRVATFELKDDTGRVWVSAWQKHAESVKDLKVGDKLIMRDAYVKRGFNDQIELSTRNTTSIVKNPDEKSN
jgi:replication factor A1